MHKVGIHTYIYVWLCVCVCGLTPLSPFHSASERDFPLHISPRLSSLQGIHIHACAYAHAYARTQSSCAIQKMILDNSKQWSVLCCWLSQQGIIK